MAAKVEITEYLIKFDDQKNDTLSKSFEHIKLRKTNDVTVLDRKQNIYKILTPDETFAISTEKVDKHLFVNIPLNVYATFEPMIIVNFKRLLNHCKDFFDSDEESFKEKAQLLCEHIVIRYYKQFNTWYLDGTNIYCDDPTYLFAWIMDNYLQTIYFRNERKNAMRMDECYFNSFCLLNSMIFHVAKFDFKIHLDNYPCTLTLNRLNYINDKSYWSKPKLERWWFIIIEDADTKKPIMFQERVNLCTIGIPDDGFKMKRDDKEYLISLPLTHKYKSIGVVKVEEISSSTTTKKRERVEDDLTTTKTEEQPKIQNTIKQESIPDDKIDLGASITLHLRESIVELKEILVHQQAMHLIQMTDLKTLMEKQTSTLTTKIDKLDTKLQKVNNELLSAYEVIRNLKKVMDKSVQDRIDIHEMILGTKPKTSSSSSSSSTTATQTMIKLEPPKKELIEEVIDDEEEDDCEEEDDEDDYEYDDDYGDYQIEKDIPVEFNPESFIGYNTIHPNFNQSLIISGLEMQHGLIEEPGFDKIKSWFNKCLMRDECVGDKHKVSVPLWNPNRKQFMKAICGLKINDEDEMELLKSIIINLDKYKSDRASFERFFQNKLSLHRVHSKVLDTICQMPHDTFWGICNECRFHKDFRTRDATLTRDDFSAVFPSSSLKMIEDLNLPDCVMCGCYFMTPNNHHREYKLGTHMMIIPPMSTFTNARIKRNLGAIHDNIVLLEFKYRNDDNCLFCSYECQKTFSDIIDKKMASIESFDS